MIIEHFEPRWLERVKEIDSQVAAIRMPPEDTTQDREWCELQTHDGRRRRIRFHDYGRVYDVPGMYEALFYERLKCCSPSRVVGLLAVMLADFDVDATALRVLDVGAGNGMVGDELDALDVQRIVGVDIIPEARTAADRDRPGVYADYVVTDLTDLPELVEERLRRHDFNCLTSVAALGFGDIPPKAFVKALDMVTAPGWLAFNIKEDFLAEHDASGFCGLIHDLSRTEVIQIQAYRRYRHRLSTAGKPLHYVAMVAKKLVDLPDELLERFE